MAPMERLEDRFRRLTIALERLDAAWRQEHRLTANEKLVITFLAADGPLSPTQLAEFLSLTTAGISSLIDRLEAEGLVERRRHPNDGRRVLVTLTQRALRVRMSYETVIAEIAAQANEVETAQVERFLELAEAVILRRTGQRPAHQAT